MCLFIYFQLQNLSNPVDLFIRALQVTGAFFFLIMTCELCEQISTAYEDFESTLLQQSWYLYPNKLKRLLPVVISLAQKEAVVQGIGSVVASRETFQRVRIKNNKTSSIAQK